MVDEVGTLATNPWSTPGSRWRGVSPLCLASFVRCTPVCDVVVTRATTGHGPCPGLVVANRLTAAIASRRGPCPWCARRPQQRSLGLS